MSNPAEKPERPFHKRLSYDNVRMTTIGGTIEIKPSKLDGWAITFEMATNYSCAAYGTDIEQAGTQLAGRLREIAAAVEADVKAFVERNK